ncbi:MAG: hypothetical protein HQL43_16710 [Alphaproteobacteria bacterium]|nr:hypothetical protein [Alphaproteobacteria bacterium]
MLDGLTPRQREIVSLIEQGRSNKEIAALLDIGVGTVKQHVAALFRRLSVSSRAQAVAALRGLSAGDSRETPSKAPSGSALQSVQAQESSALGAECRVLSVAAIALEAAESMAQSMGTRQLMEKLETLARLGRTAADMLDGQCFERAGQGIELRFGLKRARGDDAARAVQAARFVMDHLSLEDQEEPRPRGGIATGVGVVMAQSAQSARPLASAELAQAWRLAQAAPPGRLLACEATQRLTADALCFEPMPLSSAQGRSALLRGDLAPPSPPVLAPPRQTLLEQLLASLDTQRHISVEAVSGLGRTAMATSLAKRIEASGDITLYIPAGRMASGTDFACLTTALEMKLGLAVTDETAQRIARLEAFLSGIGVEDAGVLRTLTSLLSPLTVSIGIQEVAEAIIGMAKQHRLTLLIDDAERSPSFLADILARLSALPNHGVRQVYFSAGLPEGLTKTIAPLEQHRMHPLGDEDMASMISALDPEKHLDEPLVRAVVRQAQGRPGDGVELVIALLARIRTKKEGGTQQGLPMPLRLYAALIGEMDQAPDLREALRLAALLGRFFAPGLLARFWPRGQKALDDALAQAVQAKILLQEGSGASIRFAFQRPLLREAAILSWLTADRTRLRARIERTRVRVGSVSLAPSGQQFPIGKTPAKELA